MWLCCVKVLSLSWTPGSHCWCSEISGFSVPCEQSIYPANPFSSRDLRFSDSKWVYFQKNEVLIFLKVHGTLKKGFRKKKNSQQQQTKPMCIFFLNYLWFSFSAEISSFHVAGLSPTLLFQKVQAGHVRLKHCTFISNHRFQSIKALFL